MWQSWVLASRSPTNLWVRWQLTSVTAMMHKIHSVLVRGADLVKDRKILTAAYFDLFW